jgi:hypothetical protein
MPENTILDAVTPCGVESPYTGYFDEEAEPHEWPGPDAGMVFDGDGDESRGQWQRAGRRTSFLRIARNLELTVLVRGLREEQGRRERSALARFVALGRAAPSPRRPAYRRAARRPAVKGVSSAGADDSEPNPTALAGGSDFQVRHVR